MSEDVKTWMVKYRDKLKTDIAALTLRLGAIDAMIAELTPASSLALDILAGQVKVTATKPKPESKRGRHQKKSNSKVSTTDLVTMALKDAAPAGLTGREIAAVTATPIGTATSRASIMARDGKVRYEADSHRYFALHSEREDNNLQ